jgi:divalent metal cation (Fe/Co/Zn/Cd) transporter
MRLSLIFGVAMLIDKTATGFMTHSGTIFSDAADEHAGLTWENVRLAALASGEL